VFERGNAKACSPSCTTFSVMVVLASAGLAATLRILRERPSTMRQYPSSVRVRTAITSEHGTTGGQRSRTVAGSEYTPSPATYFAIFTSFFPYRAGIFSRFSKKIYNINKKIWRGRKSSNFLYLAPTFAESR